MAAVDMLGEQLQLDGLVLVRDSLEADGTFLVAHLLRHALLQGSKVVLLLVAASLSQYQQMLRKLGVQVGQYQQAGQLAVIDLLKASNPAPHPAVGPASPAVHLSSEAPAGDEAEAPRSSLPAALCSAAAASRTQQPGVGARCHTEGCRREGAQQAGSMLDLQGLVRQLAAAAAAIARPPAGSAAADRPPHTCLVVDSLSELAALQEDARTWHAFLHYCRALEAQAAGGYCCVARVHGDVEEDHAWMASLEHSAQAVLEVRPLPLGQSDDVTGFVTIEQRDAGSPAGRSQSLHGPAVSPALGAPSRQLGSLREFTYKLTEAGVRFLPRAAVAEAMVST